MLPGEEAKSRERSKLSGLEGMIETAAKIIKDAEIYGRREDGPRREAYLSKVRGLEADRALSQSALQARSEGVLLPEPKVARTHVKDTESCHIEFKVRRDATCRPDSQPARMPLAIPKRRPNINPLFTEI